MSGRTARGIAGRIIITGRLILETPAHFGNGDIVGITDMPLLRDPRDGVTPLLTGASIAGALRSYLREIERGYGGEGQKEDLAERLFGRLERDHTIQSWLLVDDALGVATGVELRDGVAIDPATRTAEDKKKFDIELLATGTAFDICLEFLEADDSRDLLPALALALDGLARGEIGLGQRKRRGFGRCRVSEWRVRRYTLTTPAGLLAWLDDRTSNEQRGSDIFDLLNAHRPATDRRHWFRIEATCGLPGSLLIRSSRGEPGSPDMVQLKSRRQGQPQPIISGTSLAGVVRGRALRIAKTILSETSAQELVNSMFGPSMNEQDAQGERPTSTAKRPQPEASRVVVEESIIRKGRDLVQSRVKIDRFTGGAFPTALFSEQPLFGNDQAEATLTFTLRNPKDAEIGLLLLVLKDLWTGDLPLGGESGVGRGRLEGRHAALTLHESDREQIWRLRRDGDHLYCEPAEAVTVLEAYVTSGLWQPKSPAITSGGIA